jgi:tetratricopeptide (TPR) repeat protein
MNTEKSITAKFDGAEKAQKTPPVSNDAQGRINVQMVQNVLLVWLDSNIDENNSDCKNTITQLRRSVNHIKTFTDSDECVDFLTDGYSEKVIMIISAAFCQQTVPLIHDIAQLHSVFLLCSNKTEHEQWTKAWPKIKGIFTEISPICEAVKQPASQCERNAISISYMSTSGGACKKNLDQLDCSFMYTQILKETLLTIEFKQEHIKEFTDYCQAQIALNDHELNIITEFERKYRDQTPVWWYTTPSFLYTMLNHGLRLMKVDVIMKMGFFICDLHRDIAQLHLQQFDGHHFGNTFTLYRGQGLSKNDFNQLKNNKGGLIAFNSFLSTSKDQGVSLMFAESNSNSPDMVGILFVMTVDPTQSTTPFASITEVGYYGDREDEVLFSMQSVFRIRDIKSMADNQPLYQVDLTLTNDNDRDLRLLTQRIREEIPGSGWFRLGTLLREMGHYEKAEEVYKALLDQTTDENQQATLSSALALVKADQGEYQEAIKLHEKKLEIYKKTLHPHDLSLAISYSNIGDIYREMRQYSEALSNSEKALLIGQQLLPPNHPTLAIFYHNLATVHDRIGDCSKALSNCERALAIRQQSLPSNHPDLALSYINIGTIYYNMGDYSKALSNYEKTLEIQQQSLPPDHPGFGASYSNIGRVYETTRDYSRALSNYEKVLKIRQQSLPPNHPHLGTSCNNIAGVYYNMGDYSKALSNYEKALEIEQQSLPPNHPDLGMSYNNIGVVYYSIRDYSKALANHEKALEIRQQSLLPNHPDLCMSYSKIGIVYYRIGDYSKALFYFEKALDIEKQSLPSNHPDLGFSYNIIGRIYDNIADYSKALSNYEKALEVQQQSLPPNHPDFGASYNKIGLVYEKMGNYSKAQSLYERAVEIGQSSLPANHPTLQQIKKNLEDVKKNL